MRTLFFSLIFLVICKYIYPQGIEFHIDNHVPNSSFEDGFPCFNNSQYLGNLDDWTVHSGTPDYKCNTESAYNGDDYVGLLSGYDASGNEAYEYLTVELEEPLIPNTEYRLSMSIRNGSSVGEGVLASYSTSNFGMVLSSSPLSSPTTGHGAITVSPQLENIIPLTSFNWESISALYIANGTERYITIGCFNTNPDFVPLYSNSYSYTIAYTHVDNVSVSPVKICEHPCPPNLGEIMYSTVEDICIVNVNPWNLKVSNVIEYELDIIYPPYGQFFYSSKGFNPNGFQNYDIIWNGNHDNGSVVPNGLYKYTLKLRNCHGFKKIEGDITVVLGNNNTLWTPNDIFGVLYNPDCCEENIYYNNEELPQFSFAENLIQATNSEINSNQEVTFLADQIILKKGFHAKPNSNFHAKIEPCQTTDSGARLFSSTSILRADVALEALSIYPNPTHDHIQVLGSENGEYVLTDLSGRELLRGQKVQRQMSLDLSDLSNGVYIFILNGQSHQLLKQ